MLTKKISLLDLTLFGKSSSSAASELFKLIRFVNNKLKSLNIIDKHTMSLLCHSLIFREIYLNRFAHGCLYVSPNEVFPFN